MAADLNCIDALGGASLYVSFPNGNRIVNIENLRSRMLNIEFLRSRMLHVNIDLSVMISVFGVVT